jgi:ATP-binding cassette subfamily B protein
MFRFVAAQRALIVAVLALSVGAGSLGAVEPLLLKRVVDALIARAGLETVAAAIGGLGVLLLVREAAQALANWLSWRARLRVQHAILDATVGKLHHLSVAYHRQQPVGMMLTKLDRGIQGFVGAFSDLAFNLVPSLVFLGLALVLMFRLEWRLAVVLTALAPVPPLIGALAAGRQTIRDRTLLDMWARIYGRFNEVLGGIVTVKSFAMEHAEQRRFVRQVGEANDLVVRGVAFDSRVSAAQHGSAALIRVVVLGYGAHLAIEGRITPGTLLAFLGYIGGLFGPAQSLVSVYQTLRRAAVSLDVLFSILDAEESVRDRPGARPATALRGEVKLDDVWFSYVPGQPVLRGITLHVPAGATVALVGPSGAGKSSLAVLLQRLYEPQRGTIQIDGVDLRALTQESLRRQIGVVMQDTSLFNDTVRANIAYGAPHAAPADVEAAARAANAHDFIAALPNGYDSEVGERGGALSAGQRQRIAIARALLKDPALVILDEATSSLDAESEAAVQAALARLLAGRTTFVIAHRLATIVNADRIVLLRAGQITDEGTHDELLARSEYYALLVALQTRGLAGRGQTLPLSRSFDHAPYRPRHRP